MLRWRGDHGPFILQTVGQQTDGSTSWTPLIVGQHTDLLLQLRTQMVRPFVAGLCQSCVFGCKQFRGNGCCFRGVRWGGGGDDGGGSGDGGGGGNLFSLRCQC